MDAYTYKTREQEILEALNIGDEVVVNEHTGHWPARPSTFATVTKITKTQITLSNGARYLLSDGQELGSKGSDYGSYISFENTWNTNNKPLTLTTRAEAEARNVKILAERNLKLLRVKLRDSLKFNELTLEQVTAIAQIVGIELS